MNRTFNKDYAAAEAVGTSSVSKCGVITPSGFWTVSSVRYGRFVRSGHDADVPAVLAA